MQDEHIMKHFEATETELVENKTEQIKKNIGQVAKNTTPNEC